MLEVLGQEKYDFFFDKFLECQLDTGTNSHPFA